MKVAAIIPARKGSKRVPGKNMADLGEWPLVWWTIAEAEGAALVERVIVTTDDEAILSLVRNHCAFTTVKYRRPKRLCDNKTPLKAVVQNLLDTQDDKSALPDALCLLQPTSPFRTYAHIDAAIRLMTRTKCDTVVSVTHDGGGYFAGEVDKRGKYKPSYPMKKRPRTQDVNRYRENGAIYLVKTSYFERTGELVGGDMRALVLDPIAGLDINEPHELEYARWLVETGRVRA